MAIHFNRSYVLDPPLKRDEDFDEGFKGDMSHKLW